MGLEFALFSKLEHFKCIALIKNLAMMCYFYWFMVTYKIYTYEVSGKNIKTKDVLWVVWRLVLLSLYRKEAKEIFKME